MGKVSMVVNVLLVNLKSMKKNLFKKKIGQLEDKNSTECNGEHHGTNTEKKWEIREKDICYFLKKI